MKAAASPVGTPWLWTLAYGQHEDRTPTHGYEPTREPAMRRSLRVGGEKRPVGDQKQQSPAMWGSVRSRITLH
jgi:hypothetical protein